MSPRAWVLNLDSDQELAHGKGFTAPRALQRLLHDHARSVASTLPDGDVWTEGEGDPRGLPGECWCPTPRALARLTAAGATLPNAPSFETLRRVNGRSFASAIHALPGERPIGDEQTASRVLTCGRWMLHREHTFAGRGHRFVDGPPSSQDMAWIRKGLEVGPLHAAPRMAVELEVALHGHLSLHGLERGVVTIQRIAHGQWRESERAPGVLSAAEGRALEETFERVAGALEAAGYRGPFGIDAFRHAQGFHPLSEINARYSMGYRTGMGRW